MQHPSLPGWEIKAEQFDANTWWGVLITRALGDGTNERTAVVVLDGNLKKSEAIAAAIPALEMKIELGLV